ncbi:hypothetical protein JCM16163A_03280 [Paenibacillus sp. YK5]|nr:hypothetical protein PN4B1_05520 [Paenibacillus naphthalenovorans]
MEREKVYNEMKPLLLSLAYHTLGSIIEAEDIVHDVFLSWEEKPPQQVRDSKPICAIWFYRGKRIP